MFKIVSLGFLWIAPLALAALPPLREELRKNWAQVIFDGKVLQIKSEIQTAPAEPLSHTDRVFTTDVLVSQVDKGELFAPGDVVQIRYWRPAKRPRGWAGPQGQNVLPQVGDEGHFYTISMESEAGILALLEPNGWERTAACSPQSYLDEIEWFDPEPVPEGLREL